MPNETKTERDQEDSPAATHERTRMTAQTEARSIVEKAVRFVRGAVVVWIVGVGILVSALGIGEVCARAILFRMPDHIFKMFATVSQYEKRPDLKLIYSYQTGFGRYPTPGYAEGNDKHNSLGFRGDEITVPKPKGVFRIACLGGSTTYDSSVYDYTKTYPAQVQAELRAQGIPAEVVNAGVPSWTSRQHLLSYVTRVSYLEPDLIIYFEPINDLIYRANWPPEVLRSDYTSPWVPIPEFARQPWYASLTLFRVPLLLAGRLRPSNWGWDEPSALQGAANLIWACGGDPDERPQPQPSTIPAGMTLKDVFAAMPTTYFANNISSLVCCAKQHHTMVLLVSSILDWQGDQSGVNCLEYVRFGVKQMDETLARIAKEQDVFYYDLAAEWPEDATTPYWDDEFHNNEAGARVKAGLIARYIIKENLASAVRQE